MLGQCHRKLDKEGLRQEPEPLLFVERSRARRGEGVLKKFHAAVICDTSAFPQRW
jgi:hypothetical protein